MSPKIKHDILYTFIIIFFPATFAFAEQPASNIQVRSYNISNIPFSAYQESSHADKSLILFATYGEKATVAYPSVSENMITDTDEILKECQAAWARNIDQVLNIQASNNAVKKYLTFDGKVALIPKDELLQVVSASEEKTVQIDPAIKKRVAEFRSRVFQVNANTSFFIYVTFFFPSDKPSVEQIIISAVKLES